MPVVRYEGWRVAIINYSGIFDKSNFYRVEKHLLTDEAFILLKGAATLIICGSGAEPGELETFKMLSGRIYNVKKNVWHHIIVSKDACVLVVENENTCKSNTEYAKVPIGVKDNPDKD